MSVRKWIATGSVIAILAVVPADRSAAQTANSVGLIEELSGRVLLRDNPQAKPSVLDPKRDVARLLFLGQQLQCAAGGQARIRIGGEIRLIKGPSDWVTVTLPPSPALMALQAALDEYGRIGGRSRGPSSRIFVPSENGVARPGDFTVRWNPTQVTPTVALAIRDIRDGRNVWHQDGIASATGVLVSPAARDALKKYRADHGSGPLVLKMVGSDEQQTQVTFSLLTIDAEQALNKDLASWDKQAGGLLRHLGRAMTYARAGLSVATAEEYEAALREAPQSRDLIARTISAEELIGDSARVKQLMKR